AHKITDTGCNVRGLAFKAGEIHFFIHPHFVAVVIGISVFAILPIAAPACIRAVDDINQALLFTGMINIVIFADDVSVFVKHKLMRIAYTVGKDLEIAAIGIGTSNNTAVWILPFLSIRSRTIKTDIADLPVQAAVGTHFYAGHAVAGKADVYAIAM